MTWRTATVSATAPDRSLAGTPPAAADGSADRTVAQRPGPVGAARPNRPRSDPRPSVGGEPARHTATPHSAPVHRFARRWVVPAIVWALCAPAPAAGATCPEAPDATLRSAFVEAERSPPKDRGGWERLRARLGGYPLFPYVELARLRKDLHRVPASEIEAFLKRHDGEGVTLLLRRRWLRQLADRRDWRKFIEWHPGDSAPIKLRCRHAQALLDTGDEAGAFAAAAALWMSGKSRPKACDPVFAVWLGSDRFSPSLAWKRIELAMADGNVRLVRYLERFLEPPDRKLAAAWRRIHENPRETGSAVLDGDPSRVEAVLVHGLERLARRDPAAAAERLAALEARTGIGAAGRAAAARRIGLTYAYRRDPRAVDWLRRVDAPHADEHARRWRVAAATLHARWPNVLEGVDSMPEKERARERWRYWRARALEAMGRRDEARVEFESLARARDYYGFLAADRLGTEYRFNHRPLAVAEETVERVAAMPALRRALELLALGRRTEARREWYALIRDFGEEDLKAASWLARCRDWHGRAILTIARTPERDDIELRFPLAFQDVVESSSSRQTLPPAMVYAFIRQESAFMADVRSRAGALGLMQIMPRTGRELMRGMGRKLQSERQLLAPELNVTLGTRYIRSLLSKTGERLPLAAASYNAGPHRVRGWLPEAGEVEAAVWIDNIPFTETRRYVRRILAYSAIYEHRLGLRPTRLSERMPPVPARAGL